MKKLIIAWLSLGVLQTVAAQQIAVGAGGQMTLYSGNSLSGNGITLTPAVPFTLTGSTLDRSSAVSFPFSNPYVTRVFTFTATPPTFTGDVTFQYDESELNGLSESVLQLLVYNGSSWQNAGLSTPDPATNTVTTTGITNLLLGQMILAGGLVLPLTWGTVTAQRQQVYVVVTWTTEQEQQVSHFDVERSLDGITWGNAVARVAAANQLTPYTYQQTDKTFHAGLLYYRIRQTDLDGRSTLSRTVRVEAAADHTRLQVQPNPATGWFSVAGVLPDKIGSVAVYNTSGTLLKTWKGFQTKYALPALTTGSYYVRIVLTTGTTETRKLLVK